MRPTSSALRRVMLLCALAALHPSRLASQATTASLQGVVTSDSGRAVASARLDIRSRETGETRQAAADEAGAYRVLGLAPGAYVITAHAGGFHPARSEAVELVVGERARVDFVLGASDAAVELAPTVVSGHAQLEVEHADVSTTVGEREIERLPLNARDALALAQIAPGVRGRVAGAFNGARFTNLYVDGAEWKGFGTGELVGHPDAGSLIPQEAIREYRVSLNPYDAEFTRGGSLVMSAVTHEGGNERQGSFFVYGQTRDLVARGTFEAAKPQYERGQIGGNLRGPILRDRVFYALSYEGQLTDGYVNVVPVRSSYAPNVWDGFSGTYLAPSRNHAAMLRLTGEAGAHTLDAIVLGRRFTNVGNFGVQVGNVMMSHDAAVSSDYRVWNAQVRDRFVSGAFVNELALQSLDDRGSDLPLAPGVTLQYPGLQTRGRTSYPQVSLSRRQTVTEKLSYAVSGLGGEHVLKSGVEIGRIHGSFFQPMSQDGFFKFPTDTSTLPSQAQIGVGFEHPTTSEDARATIGSWLAGGYAQDQWRPAFAPALRLTVGARYDVETGALDQGYTAPWVSDTVLQRVVGARYLDSRHRRNDLGNVAPRLALTWDVGGRGRTSLRAGYGRLYEIIPRQEALFEQLAWSWRVYGFTNPGTTDPAVLRSRVLDGGGRAVPNLTLLPDRMATPSNRQWSVGAGRLFGDNLVLQVDYLDQRMTHLPVTVRLNGVVNGKRPLTSRYGDIILWGDFGDAIYRGLLTTLSFERGATRWTAAYTLAWALAEFPAASSDYGDSAYYTMQPSPADERHRLVLAGTTDGPLGLQLSAIGTVASPRPFPITTGTDSNQDGVLTDDWPNGIRTSRRAGWSNWYRSVDVRVGKSFGGPRHVVATADVFNVFNTANHAGYVALSTAPAYRQPIVDYARRQGQVGIRYEF